MSRGDKQESSGNFNEMSFTTPSQIVARILPEEIGRRAFRTASEYDDAVRRATELIMAYGAECARQTAAGGTARVTGLIDELLRVAHSSSINAVTAEYLESIRYER